MTLDQRAQGWLDTAHHERFRDILFHTMARYRLCCPLYCVMPDHAHFLWIGLDARADQLRAAAWFRRQWNPLLAPHRLQRQAYDHVLREEDRARNAFADLSAYIRNNPVRKQLVEGWTDWPYTGAVFPGYPKLDPRSAYFWENFWQAYHEQLG